MVCYSSISSFHRFFSWSLWILSSFGYGSIPINTIFSGRTSINPSYFDVNYLGTIGFDTLPFLLLNPLFLILCHCPNATKNSFWSRWKRSHPCWLYPMISEWYPLVNVYKKRWKITMLSMGKSTISMVIFNSELLNYQRVSCASSVTMHTFHWCAPWEPPEKCSGVP